MTTAILATETVVLVLLTVVVAGLLRSHGEILRRLHALDGDGATERTARDRDRDRNGARHCRDRTRRRRHAARDQRWERAHAAAHSFRVVVSRAGTSGPRSNDPGALGLPDDVRVVAVVKDAAGGEHDRIARARGAEHHRGHVERGVDRLSRSGIPLLRARRRRGPAGSRRRHRGNVGAGAPLLLQAIGDDRELAIDRELLAHGIGPGDPSLYLEREDSTA